VSRSPGSPPAGLLPSRCTPRRSRWSYGLFLPPMEQTPRNNPAGSRAALQLPVEVYPRNANKKSTPPDQRRREIRISTAASIESARGAARKPPRSRRARRIGFPRAKPRTRHALSPALSGGHHVHVGIPRVDGVLPRSAQMLHGEQCAIRHGLAAEAAARPRPPDMSPNAFRTARHRAVVLLETTPSRIPYPSFLAACPSRPVGAVLFRYS
jgi:hypothetical protein